MPVERNEDFKIAISHDTGLTSVQPVITTVDIRPEQLAHNKHDLIRNVENTKTIEQFRGIGYSGISIALVIGGINYIINGIDNQDPEQVIIGASAFVFAKYISGSARNSFSESRFLSRQISRIKKAK